MAIKTPVFTHTKRLDPTDFNDISENSTNGFSGASSGDDVHFQYIGNELSDKAKVASLVRTAATTLTFGSTPTAFGWFRIDNGTKTTSVVDIIVWSTFGGATDASTQAVTVTLTWNDLFSTTNYYVMAGITNIGGTIKIEAIGIERRDSDIVV